MHIITCASIDSPLARLHVVELCRVLNSFLPELALIRPVRRYTHPKKVP